MAHQPTGSATGYQAPQTTDPNKARRWLRRLLPLVLIGVWLVATGVGGPYFARVGEVSSNDQTAYLPSSADATQVQALLGEFSGSGALPAIIVFESQEPLTDEQRAQLAEGLAAVTALPGVNEGVSPAIPSADGRAAQAFALVGGEQPPGESVAELRATLKENVPAGVDVYVTGPAGFVADLGAGFAGIDGLLLIVALLAVFVILVFVYRSLLLPLAVLTTSMAALCVALLTVWWLAKAEILLFSGQTQGILFILVIGAATDYSLLYVARYREALRVQKDKGVATRMALKGAFEPIVASGSTVIAGLLTLLLSDLKSNSTLGPVASIGIVFAMLSALTLLPALLYLFGRASFWPRKPKYEPAVVAAAEGMPAGGPWAWVARLIPRKPRLIWITTTAVLALGALGLTQLDAVGVPQSDLILGASEARDGQVVLGEHFPGGSGSPVMVVVPEASMQTAADLLLHQPMVASVAVVSAGSASGTATITNEGIRASGRPGAPAPTPTVVRGDVLLQATLTGAADSDEAVAAVRQIRAELSAAVPGALVGGVTATATDTNDASIRDRNLIIPVVLVVIVLILMVLLRSVLAPVLLVATTVLSFGTALGVAALLFNNVFGFPGADPAVPLYAFVFLVALGIDYNIFLMTRVREEALVHGTRKGVLRGLAITGGVITSAGVVLAATFAALGVIPILFLAQIAFIVAFGVLIDTFVVRSFLVPALVYDIGPAVWWPSKLAREDASEKGPVAAEAATETEGHSASALPVTAQWSHGD
ncbi:MAG: efflux RND transporter permease subunit [Trueperaceae bacterium]